MVAGRFLAYPPLSVRAAVGRSGWLWGARGGVSRAVRMIAHPSIDSVDSGDECPHAYPTVQVIRSEAATDRPILCHSGAADRNREPDLVPVRHGPDVSSVFNLYRGAAKIMAAICRNTGGPG